jgi:hypothetical protein
MSIHFVANAFLLERRSLLTVQGSIMACAAVVESVAAPVAP